MAENTNNSNQTVILDVQANTSGLQPAIDGVRKIKKDIDDVNNNPINPKVEIPTDSVKSFKQQLKEAREQALALAAAGKDNTEEYNQAVRTIAELNDQMATLGRMVDAADVGNKFQGAVKAASLLASTVQGVASGLTLIGVSGDTAAEAVAKLQAISGVVDALNSFGDAQDYIKGLITSLRGVQAAEEGVTVATTTATTAQKGLKVALASLGIGAIVLAVGYLIANFDDIKESVKKLIPGLGEAGETFDKVKAFVIGLGNAVVQYAIAPIKALIDIVKGDFKGAVEDMKKGFDVVGNVQSEYNNQRKKQADEAAREAAKKRADELDGALKIYAANGIEVLSLQKEQLQLRIKQEKEGSDEQKKAILDLAVWEGQQNKKKADEQKKLADKAAEKAKQAAEKTANERKTALDEIKKTEEENQKDILQLNMNARDKELSNLQIDYDKKKKAFDKYGQDTSNLTTKYNNQKAEINKKYDEQINQALTDRANKNLDTYKQKELEINKFYDNLLKTATDKEKELLEARRKSELSALGRESDLNRVSVEKNIKLTTTTSENTISDSDTPDQRKKKTLAVLAAQQEAEDAAYDLKKEQLAGQNAEIEQLTADHNAKLLDINRQRTEANKALDKAEFEQKQQIANSTADLMSSAGELLQENTIASKGLSAASTLIRTYESATLAYKNGLEAGGPYGIILGAISAAAAVAAGLANVKKILAVQVAGSSSSSAPSVSTSSIASASAPVINTSSLSQSTTPQDVRVVNQTDTTVRAYITDKDLKDNESKSNFFNNLSTY